MKLPRQQAVGGRSQVGRAPVVEFAALAMWQCECLIPIADTGQLGREVREPMRDLAAEGAFHFR